MDNPPDRRSCVGILLIDGFALMSYAAVVEPLRAANELAGRELYALRHITPTGAPATSSSGAVVTATDSTQGTTGFDLMLVVAGGEPSAFDDPNVLVWLRRLASQGVPLGGISGGPVILAAAGVMQGRRMTVHWEHAAELAERLPSLLIARSLYIMDRDRITCAGGTAPMDLMHALIAEQHGPELARRVSDWFMHTEVRPAGGPQRAGRVARYGTHARAILNAIEAMENHVADPLELGQLARIAGVSSRQLNRLFRSKLYQSTMGFYRQLRLETAQKLLANSSIPIVQIALATGFSSSAHFSFAYSRHYGVSPSTLRK